MPSSTRVLGTNDGEGDANETTSFSDQPYQSRNSQPSGPTQIESLDDSPAAAADERTALLSSTSPAVRRKAGSGRAANYSGRADQDPPSFHANGDAEGAATEVELAKRRRVRRPWSLRLDFGIACILLYVNFSFLLLELVGLTSPFISHNALPPHRGSMFVPIWVSFLSTVANILSLISFVHPGEAPIFAAYTNVISAAFTAIILILTMTVTQLRRHEGILTLVVLILAIVSFLHAAYSAVLTARYAPLLLAQDVRVDDTGDRTSYSFWYSIKRAASGTWSFLHISLPIVVLQVALPAVFLLLMISTVIRTIDSSVEQQGQRWKVQPYVWSRQRFPEIGTGLWETGGREFQVHVSCRGVGIDEPVPPSVAGAVSPLGRKTVRRTILIESDQGVAGRVGADWVLKMLRDGDLTSGDYEIRVCFWDRPGYGFSDSSPSSSTPQLVTALTQALTLAGEMARLEPTPSFGELNTGNLTTNWPAGFADVDEDESAMAPTPLARSGFVLVSRTYGALLSSLFATINARTVHSFLYLSPLPPALHFSEPHSWFHAVPAFFTRTIPATVSELGLWSIASVLKGQSRMSRVLSDERAGIRGAMKRAWLEEEKERDLGHDSLSWKAWSKKRGRYPERPTIVLTEQGGKHSRGRHYSATEWDAAQETFIADVVKGGLEHRDKKWAGTCDDNGGEGYEACRKALLHLVTKD